MLRLNRVATPAAGLVAAVVCASASASTLELPAGGEHLDVLLDPEGPYQGDFIVSDKLFELKSFTSQFIDASDIKIIPVDFGLAGVGFDIAGQFADVPGDGDATGFTLGYCVSIRDEFPEFSIVDTKLSFNGLALGDGAIADVQESIFDPDGFGVPLVSTLSVFSSGDVPEEDWRLEDIFIDEDEPIGFKRLDVVKDFTLFAPNANSSAGASFIRQTFSQIPGPGTGALALAGGVLALRRRR